MGLPRGLPIAVVTAGVAPTLCGKSTRIVGTGRSRHRAASASGSGVKGVATRPLDGGTLSLGRASSPARGPAAAPLCCTSRLSATALRKEERESKVTNGPRVSTGAAAAGFLLGREAQTPVGYISTACSTRAGFSPGGRVISRPRPRLRPGHGDDTAREAS